MPIKPIRLFGDPVLTSPSVPVVDFDKALRNLVSDLKQTMDSFKAVGLSAPQIGSPVRVMVWYVDGQFGHLVNPTLDLSLEIEEDEEGCLSLPTLYYKVPRSENLVAKGWTMNQEPVTISGGKLLARVIQHETDHLDGILFLDRLENKKRKDAMRKIRESQWFNQSNDPLVEASAVFRISPHA